MSPRTAVLVAMAWACGDKAPETGPGDTAPTDTSTDSADPPTDADSDGYTSNDDCDDTDPEVHPGAEEVCDGVDQDCDGHIDEDVVPTWYADLDGDGWGDETSWVDQCDAPTAYAANPGDCDDSDAAVFPNAPETCDERDQDCDGEVDEGFDADADGFVSEECMHVPRLERDCDDDEPSVNPDATEVCDDGVDNDCSGRDAFCGLSGDYYLVDCATHYLGPGGGYLAGAGEIGVGDLDGDGLDDIAASAPGANNYDGGAFLVYGPHSGERTFYDEGLWMAGSGQASLPGVARDLVDLDGDGFDDLGFNSGFLGKGPQAWLFFGPVSGFQPILIVDSADAHLSAGETNKNYSSLGFGDVDGDGAADVLLGTPELDLGAGNNSGGAFLLRGPVTSGMEVDLQTGATAILKGDQEGGWAGGDVHIGADLSGDGIGDLIVGGPGASHAVSRGGTVYLVHGPVSGEVDLGSANGMVIGAIEDEWPGTPLLAGDVNGDGLDDIIAAAPVGSTMNRLAGTVYVVYGPATGTSSLSDAHATIHGAAAEDELGTAIASADIDADGQWDLLIGVPYDDTVAEDAGAAHLFFGPVTGVLSPHGAQASFYGAETEEYAGKGVGIGDLNGDGLGDPMIGSYGSSWGGVLYVQFPYQP